MNFYRKSNISRISNIIRRINESFNLVDVSFDVVIANELISITIESMISTVNCVYKIQFTIHINKVSDRLCHRCE